MCACFFVIIFTFKYLEILVKHNYTLFSKEFFLLEREAEKCSKFKNMLRTACWGKAKNFYL